MVQTTRTLASLVAQRVLAYSCEDITDEDRRDVLAEIANMTAGNIKPLLPGPSFLSLPAVTNGSDYSVIVSKSRCVAELDFQCHGQPVHVAVWEAEHKSPLQKGAEVQAPS